MKVIGLTGGIASGKTEVAKELEKLGAAILDADQAAHEALDLPSVQSELVGRWGAEILTAKGQVDRTRIAAIVFADNGNASDELRFLEQTLHPRIREQFEMRLAQLSDSGTAVAVIDAPLLLEAGWKPLCDGLIFVESAREQRMSRAKQRNWSEAEFTKREACQMPIAEKRQRSTQILVNAGSLEDLRDQVTAFWQSLCL